MDIQDMESYYKGQLDLATYLYELLVTKSVSEVVEYLSAVYDSTESRCRRG